MAVVDRPDLLEATSSPDFVWRSLPMLTELAPHIGKLTFQETLPKESSDDSDEQKQPDKSALATMLGHVAESLRTAASGLPFGQASKLSRIAAAFLQAAQWEQTLAPARQWLGMDDKAPVVREVIIEVGRAIDSLVASAPGDGGIVIFPAGWQGHNAGEVPSNLVMLVITLDEDAARGAGCLSVTVCNAGQGAYQYHPSEYELPPTVMLRPCVHLPGIAAEVLQDRAMLWMLALLRVHPVFYNNQSVRRSTGSNRHAPPARTSRLPPTPRSPPPLTPLRLPCRAVYSRPCTFTRRG